MQNTGLNKYDWIGAAITLTVGLVSAAGGILSVVFGQKAMNLRQPIKK